MRRLVSISLIGVAALLCSCGGASSDDPTGPPEAMNMNTKAERDKWEAEGQKKFAEANAAIEKTKALLASVKIRGNAELLSSLTQAQAAIQDVSQKQKNLNGLFALALGALEELGKQNATLTAEKKVLEGKRTDLEARERLFSMGFYTSLAAALLAVIALLVKLPTALLDRKYRTLEILQKRIEVRKLRREVTSTSKSQ